MTAPEFSAGPESQEVALLAWDDVPWDALAFSSVAWALESYRDGSGPAVHTAAPGT